MISCSSATSYTSTELLNLGIGLLALIVACYSAMTAKDNQERNEKFLRYSFRLERKHLEGGAAYNKRQKSKTKKDKTSALKLIDQVIAIRGLFAKEFPDPTLDK